MPSTTPKVLLAWSSGKDSTWTLHVLREKAEVEVVGLLTTIEKSTRRVSMHETPEELVRAQADAVGLPLWPVEIPWPCPNTEYEAAMGAALARAKHEGVTQIAFGDLFLEDIRDYRIAQMKGTGMEPVFPLWLIDTRELAHRMVAGGLKAIITCVDTQQAPAELAGQEFGIDFLATLPESVDPCGERGEFHTFAWDGPMFGRPVLVHAGEAFSAKGFARVSLRGA